MLDSICQRNIRKKKLGEMDGGDSKQNKDGPKQAVDRDKVKAEREARRLAKVSAKQKNQDMNRNLPDVSPPSDVNPKQVPTDKVPKKQQPPKKQQKQNAPANSEAGKIEAAAATVVRKLEQLRVSDSTGVKQASNVETSDEKTKKVLTKAERRAIQEAQRAAKASKSAITAPGVGKIGGAKPGVTKQPDNQSKVADPKPFLAKNLSTVKDNVRKSPAKTVASHRVKLFNHLYTDQSATPTNIINSADLPAPIIRLGVQYATGVVKGCNARCIAFLHAIKLVIQEYQTPAEKEFGRSFETALKTYVEYLHTCRPIAVSVLNAVKYLRWQITQLPEGETEAEHKTSLAESVDTYIRDQIEKAAEAISITMQEKISDGDVIMTFGCSSLIQHILLEAKAAKRNFRVVVVDARPSHEGLELLRRLVANEISCTCVQINAVGFIMPQVTKVLLGAHALLTNGYVMSRTGTAQVALIAKHFNVPVLVCCETHKFSERVQTDAFVYNEIGNPSDLVTNTKDNAQPPLANWESIPHLTPLNLCYDVTPPELVTAVVTEIAILPCTSVPVILRIKPSEMGY